MPIKSKSVWRVPPALRDRNFSLYWFGWTLSLCGDQICFLALPWLVLQQTGSVIATGTILTSAAAPRAALMIFGGALSDRISPRQIMLVTAVLRCILIGLIAALIWTHSVTVWGLCVLAFLYGVADAGALPAAETYIVRLMPSEQLPAANSLLISTAQLVAVVAPLPAGILVKYIGLGWPFFLDALSFVLLAIVLSMLPNLRIISERSRQREPLWKDAMEGATYIWNNIPLRTMMLIAASLNFTLAGPIGVGLPEFVRITLRSPSAFGTAMSCMAGGGLAGSLLANVRYRLSRSALICVSTITIGTMLMVIGATRSFLLLCISLIVIGFFGGIANVHLISWIQQFTADEVRGRVMGVLMLIVIGMVPLSFELAGILMAWSFQWTFLLAGVLMTVMSIGAWSQREIRKAL